MLFKVLARLGFPPKIVSLVRVFHENVILEVDLDDGEKKPGQHVGGEDLNQQVPGLGRGDDTDMADGDLADKWLYLDGYGERPCTLAELTARSKAREEAARVSQRISAEEAKAKTVPAAQ